MNSHKNTTGDKDSNQRDPHHEFDPRFTMIYKEGLPVDVKIRINKRQHD
jgi:hypothetical protein